MGPDDTDFLDQEFSPAPAAAGAVRGVPGRAPSREELDAQFSSTQEKLSRLKAAQEQLERARQELEEMRRRRQEFQVGRTEMRDQLHRGVGILEKAEHDARREAEQLARSLEGLREALVQVEALHEETWTESNWNIELSRALTTIENARMEWSAARLKWPLLEGRRPDGTPVEPPPTLTTMGFRQLCRVGLGLTWPLLVLGLLAVVLFALALWKR